jgi:hypothetical protein
MSKFEKYDLPATTGGQIAEVAQGSALARALERGRRTAALPGAAARLAGSRKIRAAIALDGTGSMGHLIDTARTAINEIVRRVTAEAGVDAEMELFVYRDYDVPHALLERSGASTDPAKLAAWLKRINPEGGGANDGEAVETALDAILSDGSFTVALVAGDEPSNSAQTVRRNGRQGARTALEIVRDLRSRQTPVHTFVVGDHRATAIDFGRLAEAGGGKTGKLDGSRDMVDLAVMSILASAQGSSAVHRYMEHHQLTANARAFGQLLLGSK